MVVQEETMSLNQVFIKFYRICKREPRKINLSENESF